MYDKFINELLSGKRRLRDGENFFLAEECGDTIQRKPPPKLTDPGRFIIPYSIGPVKVNQSLCDLKAIINMTPLSMMRRLGCGEPKFTHMTLTLSD